MECKLFSRFRSLREAYRMIDQDEKGIIRRRSGAAVCLQALLSSRAVRALCAVCVVIL
jgi:hypothetical protein